MNREYTLIVGHDFSLCNETDSDPMTDYNPGIWGIKTQKSALKFARDILAHGDSITVKDYDNARYHALANKFIKALGLDQPLFVEPVVLVSSPVTAGKPATLSALKKYLVVGSKVNIKRINFSDGSIAGERETFVKRTQTNAIVFDKNGSDSWLELGKASEWTFDDQGATQYVVRTEGTKASVRIEYLTN